MRTPVSHAKGVALAEFAGALYMVYAASNGELCFRTADTHGWSAEYRLGVMSSGHLALAATVDRLVLVYETSDRTLQSLTYGLNTVWSTVSTQLLAGSEGSYATTPDAQKPSRERLLAGPEGSYAVRLAAGSEGSFAVRLAAGSEGNFAAANLASQSEGNFALAAFDGGQRLMLVYQTSGGGIQSRTYQRGQWGETTSVPGATTGGSLTLCSLGPSLYLVHTVTGSAQMAVVSYNTAPFNIVTVPTNKYGGAQDNTSRDAWSPSEFPSPSSGAGPTTRRRENRSPSSGPTSRAGHSPWPSSRGSSTWSTPASRIRCSRPRPSRSAAS